MIKVYSDKEKLESKKPSQRKITPSLTVLFEPKNGLFSKGVQIIIFIENGPKIESTAFLNQSIFMKYTIKENRIRVNQ